MKKIIAALLAALLLLSLAACRGTEQAPETTQAPTTEARTEANSGQTEAPATEAAGDKLAFSTTDLEGNAVTMEDFSQAKLVVLNFWEPWCGPCVGEMPDLEKLYETYKDKGLVILGAFNDQEEDAKALVKDRGITYPILHYTEVFYQFQTGYVPTTVLLAGDGTLLSEEPIIGSMGYEDWEKVVLPYLGG